MQLEKSTASSLCNKNRTICRRRVLSSGGKTRINRWRRTSSIVTGWPIRRQYYRLNKEENDSTDDSSTQGGGASRASSGRRIRLEKKNSMGSVGRRRGGEKEPGQTKIVSRLTRKSETYSFWRFSKGTTSRRKKAGWDRQSQENLVQIPQQIATSGGLCERNEVSDDRRENRLELQETG